MGEIRSFAHVRSFPANAALGENLLVTINSSGKYAVAGASDTPDGITDREAFAADEVKPVRLLNGGGTFLMTASEAITVGADVYMAASGKIATTGTVVIGKALTAAGGDGELIEVLTQPAVA